MNHRRGFDAIAVAITCPITGKVYTDRYIGAPSNLKRANAARLAGCDCHECFRAAKRAEAEPRLRAWMAEAQAEYDAATTDFHRRVYAGQRDTYAAMIAAL